MKLFFGLIFGESRYVFIRNAVSTERSSGRQFNSNIFLLSHFFKDEEIASSLFELQGEVFLIIAIKIIYKNASFYLRYLNVMIPEVLRRKQAVSIIFYFLYIILIIFFPFPPVLPNTPYLLI